MLKEFIKKNLMVSLVALGLTILGTNAKADFFRWYLADDVAHNGDGRTLCFEINAYGQVLRGGNPVDGIFCGYKPELGIYREVADVLGFRHCYEFNALGAYLNHGAPVSQSFCFENSRLERERLAREWRQRDQRARIDREIVRARLERERIARERREREEREREERERRERDYGHHDHRGRHFSSNDSSVEDTDGTKNVAPVEKDGIPDQQEKASKEVLS